MKFNFRKIASAASSLLMIGSTVALAAAANYPAPFVQGSTANVAIVSGESATFDAAAATALQSDLSAAFVAGGGSSSSGNSTVPTGGDFVKLEKSSDRLNLGDSMSGVFGSTVDDGDLPDLLADGTYLNDENTEYGFEQRLTLQPINMTFFTDSDFNDEEPTVGFHINSNTPVLNYTLDFTTDAESDVSSSGDLPDFETTDFTIMGKKFYVLDAQNGSNANYFGKFTLLDAANTATVQEAQPQTVTVDGRTYNVAIDFITSSSVKLTINGVTTNSLAEGETYKLSDGSYVGVKDILYDTRDGKTSSVEFSIGSGKIEIDSTATIQVNDEDVDGMHGWFVRGSPSGSKQRLDKLVIQWDTDEESFVAPGSDLVMPAMGGVKLSMTDFTMPMAEVSEVKYSGDDDVQLNVPFKDGSKTFTILHANTLGNFTVIGEDTNKRLATSPTTTLVYNQTLASDDYHTMFIATYNTTNDAESYLLSAKVTESDGRNRTTIKNEVTGQNVCEDKIAGDTCNIGDLSLTISSVTKTSTAKAVTFTAGSNVNFNTVFTEEGLKIYLPFEVNGSGTEAVQGAINLSVSSTAGHSPGSFYLFFNEENKDGDKGAGNPFNVTLTHDSDSKVEVSAINTGQSNLDIPDSDNDQVSRVKSDLATKVEYLVASDRGQARITYSGDEAYGNVYLTAAGATTTTGGSGGALGNIIVTDSQISTVSSKNLIILGGSCVNSAARKLIDSSATAAICGSAFTAKTNVQPGQFVVQAFSSPWSNGKVALLVAGYETQDTMNAVTWLKTNGNVDTALMSGVGKKYIGTSATSAALV